MSVPALRPANQNDAPCPAPDPRGPPRLPPVNWYAPDQLLRTGVEVLATSLFGQRADARRLSAGAADEAPFEPPASDEEALWIDFAADSGDGFDPTFTVARALARDLTVEGEGCLSAGRVLVLGGDQVYPTPSDDAYEKRFLALFRAALPAGDPRAETERHLYALPGNHDWYDGLVEFSRVFCTGGKIGPWQTRQRRSYFAVQLSPELTLLAVDTQVCQDIDRDQLAYFRQLMERWQRAGSPPAQVIVVTAEPYWETSDYDARRTPRVQRVDIYAKKERHLLGTLLSELEQSGTRVLLQLTGDLHHYRRYATADGKRQLITAGGAGAFVHPTHTRLESPPIRHFVDAEGEARCEAYAWGGSDFPSPAESRRLARGNLQFGVMNPSFAGLLGALYLLLGLVMPPARADGLLELLLQAPLSLVVHTGSAFVFFLALAAVVAFTDTVSARYRWWAGTLHGLMHLTAALVLSWLLRDLRVDLDADSKLQLAAVGRHVVFVLGMLSGGYLLGGLIWGAYLYVSVSWFGRHGTEAFSSLRNQDFKCFVRMKLTADALVIYPLGLRKTPRAWTWDPHARTWHPRVEPRWALIEPPIAIPLVRRETEVEPLRRHG
ncbi:MAG: hypothetical protein ABW252_13510 [Polyangiales bacterium]